MQQLNNGFHNNNNLVNQWQIIGLSAYHCLSERGDLCCCVVCLDLHQPP